MQAKTLCLLVVNLSNCLNQTCDQNDRLLPFSIKATETDASQILTENKESPEELPQTLFFYSSGINSYTFIQICASPDQGGYLQLDLGLGNETWLVEYLTDMQSPGLDPQDCIRLYQPW